MKKPIVKKLLPRLLLYIGVGVGISAFGLSTYKTAYGTAVDAGQLTRIVRDDVVKVFVDQVPALKSTTFTMNVFNGAKFTDCGKADISTGPFYCPLDKHIALPLSFFNTICDSLKACTPKASNEYVYSYILAHEAAHKVQDHSGLFAKLHSLWDGYGTVEYYAESVNTELQADCLAGVYMGVRFGRIKEAPVAFNVAVKAARALGDDTLQPNLPTDQYTHGSAEQRAQSFERGFVGKNVKTCGIN